MPTLTEPTDAANSTATTYSMVLGDTFDGRVSSSGDRDWIRVELVQGVEYVITQWGRDGQTQGLNDTVLNLRDANGNIVLTNDDASNATGVLFSVIRFTPTSSGTFYIDAGAFGTETGNYTVQLATSTYNTEQVATFISEYFWGAPTPFTFDATPTQGQITFNIDNLTADGQQLALWALEVWSQTTGLLFTRVNGVADISFDDNQNGAFAGPTQGYNPDTGDIVGSTVNIGTGWLNTYGTTLDSYSFLTYLHEIGHALGLGHGGLYDGSANFSTNAFYLTDSYQQTIMSYFDVVDNTFVNGVDGRPLTPMLADLLAIALQYGNPDVMLGDTIWGRGNTLGGILGLIWQVFTGDAAPNPTQFGGGIDFMLTIADSGGIDTLDVSYSTFDQRIDLRSGTFSDINGQQNNVAISTLSVIENARGGSGNDSIEGNEANNNLLGNSGNDTIFGRDGNDVIEGGENDDFLSGGNGNDTVSGGNQDDYVEGQNGNDSLSGGSGNDFMYGDANDDTMNGDDGNDTLYGGSSNDTLRGGTGNDSLFGDFDHDRIEGASGNDTADGGNGNDTMFGGIGNDMLQGGLNDDLAYGENGNDTLQGSDGNDTLVGGLNDDLVQGGAANDALFGEGGNDRIEGASGNDLVDGGDGNDTLLGGIGNDLLQGGLNDDLAYGENGNDTVQGSDGNDTLVGGLNDDLLQGGTGNDLLQGETGADRLEGNSGNDTAYGGDGADLLLGGIGNDQLFGDLNDDLLYGESGNDLVNGGDGNDILFGGADADTLQGGNGNDQLNGDAGNDRIEANSGNDTINGGDGNDLVLSGIGNDSVFGGLNDDVIYGETGNDVLNGDAGNDLLLGAGGNDTLSGGAGSDALFGGSEADTFVFATSNGVDVIHDFSTTGGDVIDLRGVSGGPSTLSAVLAISTDVNGGTLIDFGGGNSIFLANVLKSQLSLDDFIF